MKNVIYFILVSLLVFTSCKKDSNPTSPSEDVSTVTYSGKVYHTVKIGNQTWLKENLDVGAMIQGTANPSNNGVIEKYCYDNDTVNCSKYGGLYQWDEAMAYDTANGAKGICPDGWHIPTEEVLRTLQLNAFDLLAIGQGTAATDSSGFSALLAGCRDMPEGGFFLLGSQAFFWSSTTSFTHPELALPLHLYKDQYFLGFGYYNKLFGYSIRCIKDN